ncbi:MAG TPA: glycosyltransferase family 1 protein, partial [Acidimicrobiales bacterium]|nr:glycosyltransferase family 1 protein [Acidimicrobiales bacterium]
EGEDLTLFVNAAFRAAHPRLAETFPVVVAPVSGAHKSLRVAAEATWLVREARRQRIDLLHHMGGNMLRSHPPGMVTIHDLQPFAHPRNFSHLKHAYLRATVPRSLRQAVLVVTLTEHTRRDVVDRMGVPPERIHVVPPGITRREVDRDQAEVARVRDLYQLGTHPYFIYPTITYPHKNHLTLVRAFARLAATDPEPLLVLPAGPAGAEAALQAEIDELRVRPRIRRLGRIPRPDLDALIDGATALAFPSSYEGFGIPVLEAMSRRCPVIASTATALPEVVGDAGLLVDPDDVEGWAAAMRTLLEDPSTRRDLAERGYARAGEFSWERSVEALGAAYDAAFDRIAT